MTNTTDAPTNEADDLELEARALGLSPDEAEREVDDFLGMMGGVSLDPLPEPEGHVPDALTEMVNQPAFMLSYLPTEPDRLGGRPRRVRDVYRLDALDDIRTKIEAFVADGTISEYTITPVGGSLDCPKCKGTGTTTLEAISPPRVVKCLDCNGPGHFDAPPWADIAPKLFTKRGDKIALRKSPPNSTADRRSTHTEARRYYVWRMARFNGGIDMHMPMEANWVAGGDPWMPVLDLYADAIALVCYGSHSRGAERWAAALGHPV